MESGVDLQEYGTGALVALIGAGLAELATRPDADTPALAMDQAEHLMAALDLGEYALAQNVGHADRSGEALAARYPGTKGWLRISGGMKSGRADERLVLARQLPRLPKTAQLMQRGELSLGYAATICYAVARLSDDDCARAEPILLEAVERGLSVLQIAKLGDRIKDLIADRDDTAQPPDDDSKRPNDRSWWKLSRSLRGGASAKGWFNAELQALIKERLGPLAKPTGPEDTRDHDERMADALKMLLTGDGGHWNATLVITIPDISRHCTTTSNSGSDASSGGNGSNGGNGSDGNDGNDGSHPGEARRPEHQQASSAGGRQLPVWPWHNSRISARLGDGTPMPSWQARIIALNAGVSALILGPDGIPLYLGKNRRLFTPDQRRVMEALYDTCAAKECDIPARLCQLDHVHNWSEDGTTDIDMLAPACSFHNRLKYQKPEWFEINRDTQGRWQYTIDRRRGRPKITPWDVQGPEP